MKRRVLSLLLIMTMGISLLVGCGGTDKDTSGVSNQGNDTNVSEETEKADSSNSKEESEDVSSEMTTDAIFEVNSIGGTKVKVYYDPNAIASTNTVWEPEFSVTDIEGNVYSFVIGDFDTAEDYFERRIDEFNSIQSKTNEEFSELEEYEVVGENTIMRYTLEYDQISTDDNNNPVYTPVSYAECIIELDSVVVCFDYTEEQKFWDVLATMKFVVGNENDTESNQNDSNEAVVEGNLNTYELSNFKGEKIGVLTYNGDTIEFDEEVYDSKAYFDVCIKNEEGGKYNTHVAVETVECADAETYYQERKNVTELNEKVTGSQFSEIKETDVNGITVQYFNRIYTMNGNENKDFYCFVDFPVIGNKEYAVVLEMPYGREEEFLLSGVKNLLVDIEIQGVKPGATAEDTSVKNDEFDEINYYPEYLTTPDGKTVAVYMDINADITGVVDSEVPSSIYIYDKNDDVGYFSVDDAVSAEEYANNILQWNDYLEIGSHEEIQLAGRTIHMYHFADKETGDAFISEGVIQLASDVVFTFTYNHMKYDESGLEEVLEALRFIVE